MVKSLVVTKEIAVKAILFGACKVPVIGSRIEKYTQSDLIWAERLEINTKLPLWVNSGSGYGSGYGDGDGDGSGSNYKKIPELLN